jgi:hypothetical protein
MIMTSGCGMKDSIESNDDMSPWNKDAGGSRGGARARRNRQARARYLSRYMHDEWLARARHLENGDRILLEKSIGEGMSAEQLGGAFRVSAAHVRRRLRRIKRLLNDPCFLLVAHYGDCLPVAMRALARRYFVEGLSMRQCASRYQMSLHRVRQQLAIVRSLLILRNLPVDVQTRALEQARAVQRAALNHDRS